MQKPPGGLKTITGYTKEKTPLESEDIEQLANDLNVFYTRFEKENNNAGHNFGDLVVSTAISSDEVRSMFKSVNERKATGPDRISSKVLKVCNLELCDIFKFLFNESIVCGTIPSIWKTATIIPVPKKDKPTVMNDYRPVALTPVTMKCLEKIILSRLLPCITPSMDKLQFAYRQNRSIEDAIITVLNYIYQHLDTSGSYVRALFIDYSSAFNTIIPNILINKLKAYGVEPYLCAWISDFLNDRKQQVCIASQGQFVYSQMLTTNTGAPQGCVLSPVLFTMYTNDCTSHSVLCKLIKYADDSILLGLIKSENELAYRQEIIHLSHWCKNHNLLLNVQKTKEVIFDFRKKCSPVDPVYIENEHVEIVEKYKYLGTYIRNDLKWYDNVEFQCKKAQKRLYFLRKLKEFKVDTKLLELFYKSVVESVAISCIIVWFKALTVNDIKSLKRIKRQAERITGIKLESFDEIYCNRVIKKVKCILEDESHPLSHLYQVLPSGKRFKSISCKTKRSAQSFLPTSVSLCNAKDTLRDLISMN